jgi:hypothetical protein
MFSRRKRRKRRNFSQVQRSLKIQMHMRHFHSMCSYVFVIDISGVIRSAARQKSQTCLPRRAPSEFDISVYVAPKPLWSAISFFQKRRKPIEPWWFLSIVILSKGLCHE